MSRLPTGETLGARPTPRSSRSVVPIRTDTALNAAARGFRQTSRVAAELGNVAGDFIENQQRQKLAKARSDFLVGKVALDAEFAEDRDFETAEKRYAEALAKLRETSSEGLFGPSLNAFGAQTDVDIARGTAVRKADVGSKRRIHNLAELAGTLDTNREAMLTALDPETRQSLLDASMQSIQGMIDQGFLTPLEGGKMGREIGVDFAVSRVKMQPPAEQLRLLDVPEGWSPGDQLPPRKANGSTVDFIPADQRVALARAAQVKVERQNRLALVDLRRDAKTALDFARSTGEESGDVEQRLRDAGEGETANDFARQRDANIEIHDTVEELALATPAEINEWAAAHKPEEPKGATSDQAREFLTEQAVFQEVAKGVLANRKALAADPAGFVMRDPDVRDAVEAAQASPTDPALALRAAEMSLDAQEGLGIPATDRRVLTTSQARALVAQIEDPETGARGQAQIINALSELYGPVFTTAYRDLVREGLSEGRQVLALLGDRPEAAVLAQALDDGPKVLIAALGVDGADTAKTIEDGVRQGLADYTASIIRADRSGLGGSTTFTEGVIKGVYTLALGYAARGEPPESAITKATAVIRRKYEFQDGYRIPLKYFPDQVEAAVANKMANLESLDLAPPPSGNSGLSTKNRVDALIRTIRANPIWVTNEDETGLVLLVDTNQGAEVARSLDGERIEIMFEDTIGLPALLPGLEIQAP